MRRVMTSTFSKFIISLSLGAFSVSPAFSAEGKSEKSTKEAKRASSAALPKDDAVVAEVDGVKITFKEVRDIHNVLPEQLKQLPFEKLYDILVQRVIELRLLEKKAADAGIEKEEDIKKKVEEMTKNLYKKEFLNREIKKLLTQDVLRRKYNEVRAAIEKDKNREKQTEISIAFFDNYEDAKKLERRTIQSVSEFIKESAKVSKNTTGEETVTATQSMLSKSFPENIVAQIFKQVRSTKKLYTIPGKEKKYMVVFIASSPTLVPVPSFQEAAPQIARAMEGEMTQRVVDNLRQKAKIKIYTLDGREEELDESGLPLRLKKEIEESKKGRDGK